MAQLNDRGRILQNIKFVNEQFQKDMAEKDALLVDLKKRIDLLEAGPANDIQTNEKRAHITDDDLSEDITAKMRMYEKTIEFIERQ